MISNRVQPFFCAQAAAPSEPVIGTVYADSFHEADPDYGIAAIQTVQVRLLTLSKENKGKLCTKL